MRATVSDMGPLLLARLLGLNDTQAGCWAGVQGGGRRGFAAARSERPAGHGAGCGEQCQDLHHPHGNVSTASIGAILRNLLTLESAGGDHFFGEPMLDIQDLMQTDEAGHGHINVLAAGKLTQSSRLYACFLLWLLSELLNSCPRWGSGKPVLVFFFDEAHLLFKDAPRALLEKIELVVRLIRSKGGRLFRDPEPGRHPRQRAGAAWQPGAARPARLHPERSEGGAHRRQHPAGQPGLRRRRSHH